jgi:hypothetical protein
MGNVLIEIKIGSMFRIQIIDMWGHNYYLGPFIIDLKLVTLKLEDPNLF